MASELAKAAAGQSAYWTPIASDTGYGPACPRCGTRQTFGEAQVQHLRHAHGEDLARLNQFRAELRDRSNAVAAARMALEAACEAEDQARQRLADLEGALATSGLAVDAPVANRVNV